MHALGHFEVGDLRLQCSNELGFAGRMSGLGDDDRRDRFAKVRIGNADEIGRASCRERVFGYV